MVAPAAVSSQAQSNVLSQQGPQPCARLLAAVGRALRVPAGALGKLPPGAEWGWIPQQWKWSLFSRLLLGCAQAGPASSSILPCLDKGALSRAQLSPSGGCRSRAGFGQQGGLSKSLLGDKPW